MDNLLSNIANSIPVVGHIKGFYHYASGEKEKGDEAMYQSSRTSAVIVGGLLAGPTGAIGAGLATDAAASALAEEPKGVINSCKNIADDLEANRNPTCSIAFATLQLGLDGISGIGGSPSGVSNASTKAVEKTIQTGGEQIIQKSVRISAAEMAKMVGQKTAVKPAEIAFERAIERAIEKTAELAADKAFREAAGKAVEITAEMTTRGLLKSTHDVVTAVQRIKREEHERREGKQQREKGQNKSNKQEESKKKEQQANSEQQKQHTPRQSSGSSQPPQGNKNNNENCKEKNESNLFEVFMALLRRILKKVYGNKREPFFAIFENLLTEERKYLLKVLKPLMRFGTLDAVVELVIRMFKQCFSRDKNITFGVFLSLLDFVQTYITDELLEPRLRSTSISSRTETAETTNERRRTIIAEIVNQKNIINSLMNQFAILETEIEAETATWNCVFPNFRDIFAAVYHYFKHRKVPSGGKILTVREYYGWIQIFFNEFKSTSDYFKLKTGNIRSFVYERYVPIFRRRFKIVLKFDGDEIVLSSAYVVDMKHPDDEKYDEKSDEEFEE